MRIMEINMNVIFGNFLVKPICLHLYLDNL